MQIAHADRQTANGASSETLDYLTALPAIIDLDTLQRRLAEITRAIGFDVFVLGQLPQIGHAQSYFQDHFLPAGVDQRGVSAVSAIRPTRSLTRCSMPTCRFCGKTCSAYRNPTAAQAEYIAVSTEYGFLRGYTVPVRTPGEPIGVVSFATKDNGPVPREMLPFAQQIAVASFKRAAAHRRARARARPGELRPDRPATPVSEGSGAGAHRFHHRTFNRQGNRSCPSGTKVGASQARRRQSHQHGGKGPAIWISHLQRGTCGIRSSVIGDTRNGECLEAELPLSPTLRSLRWPARSDRPLGETRRTIA